MTLPTITLPTVMKRLAALAAVTAALSFAQQPAPRGFFAWWDSPIARDLNLQGEQNQQIREVVRSYRNKLIDQRSAMDKAEGDFEDVFNDEKLDQRKANEVIERLAAARADMSRAMSQMSLKLRTILTIDQWHELQKRMPKGPPPAMNGPGRPGQGRPGGQGQGQPPPPPPPAADQ